MSYRLINVSRFNLEQQVWAKYFSNTLLPIQNDIKTGPIVTLKSRKIPGGLLKN